MKRKLLGMTLDYLQQAWRLRAQGETVFMLSGPGACMEMFGAGGRGGHGGSGMCAWLLKFVSLGNRA